MSHDTVAKLHAALVRRDTPETIARIILQGLGPGLGHPILRLQLRLVSNASVPSRFRWSSMSATFRAPVRPDRQVAKARELAELFLGQGLPESDDPDVLEAFARSFAALIGKEPGRSSFMHDRLGRGARSAAGLSLSRRRYSKLFRLAGRLERRVQSLRREESRHRFVLLGKAALAPDLTLEDFAGHLPTAAFVAYYAARMKLRSEFTAGPQQRAFDTLAERLLRWCASSDETRWFAVAHVFPRSDVLARLTEEQKAALLRRWYGILTELAEQLETAWSGSGIDLDTMIVRKGNDSSTWNILAGAWNRARDHWIALIEAMELDALFDAMLPGKVMRLMAADVAAWHRNDGGTIHPDTLVWRDLAKPWDVLRGERRCTRAEVEAACARRGVDPGKSGWAAARPRTAVAEFRPTPELVHGVTVDNPWLAQLFREARVYSGKKLRTDRLLGSLED